MECQDCVHIIRWSESGTLFEDCGKLNWDYQNRRNTAEVTREWTWLISHPEYYSGHMGSGIASQCPHFCQFPENPEKQTVQDAS